MKQKVMVLLVLFFISLSFVSAEAILEIQTLPNHEIFITEIDAYSSGDIAVKQPLHTFTGELGKVELPYTPEKNSFKLGLLLKDDTKTAIKYKVLEDVFHDEEVVKIEFLPVGMTVEDVLASMPEKEEEVVEDTAVETNETVVENTNETLIVGDAISEEDEEDEEVILEESEVNETSPGFFKSAVMQGSAVLHENKPIVNVVSYCLVAVILAVPIFLFVKKHKGKIANQMEKIGDMLPDKLEKSSGNENDFEKAEEDLKKARERIEELKGDKIKKAREKLLEDEKELMRLRKLGKD